MKIGFIGAGNMGGALARAAALGENEVYIYDKDGEKATRVATSIGATASTDARELASVCDCIMLGVKPNILPSVVEEIGGALGGGVLVSMAAGVSIEKIQELLKNSEYPIIRIMPNTPVAVGMGTVLCCANVVGSGRLEEFKEAFREAGELFDVEEGLIDAGTAVSGCGPAFVYMFIDAMAKGGEACGLTREAALAYACQTVAGAAKMLASDGRSPDELRDAVCSPGGSTIEGVKSLQNDGFYKVVADAVGASYRRTVELGK